MDINWTELIPPERKRTYHFPNGGLLVLEDVARIEVRESKVHRIETAAGRKVFVSPTWNWLEIETGNWNF